MSVEAVIARPFYPGWLAGGLVSGNPPPTLTGVTANASSSTAELRFSTDVALGTGYFVVTESAIAPSAPQVKAGTDENGAAPVDSGSRQITSTGSQGMWANDMTPETTYYGYIVHSASGGDSAVGETGSFVTTVAGSRRPNLVSVSIRVGL